MNVSYDLEQDRQALGASVRDVVNSIGDTGSTRPEWRLPQVQDTHNFDVNGPKQKHFEVALILFEITNNWRNL